ncbi:KOW domain-containing RNA-binding protein [Crassaminicella profunda]|uniref:KOW domain-containing RNA-binding protein n=1 Tax=Crassaminicella profunda TaxID=1286698 RepID=UPI001FE5B33B|nr:KOW domain-containing RNA-binding protein [Crassaminicella profunda]
MDTTHEIAVGQIVKSKAGRDKDRAFIVLDIVDEQYVLIADGDLRKIDKSKKKKMKHLQKYNIISDEVKNRIENNDKINNLLLRRELEKLGLS